MWQLNASSLSLHGWPHMNFPHIAKYVCWVQNDYQRAELKFLALGKQILHETFAYSAREFGICWRQCGKRRNSPDSPPKCDVIASRPRRPPLPPFFLFLLPLLSVAAMVGGILAKLHCASVSRPENKCDYYYSSPSFPLLLLTEPLIHATNPFFSSLPFISPNHSFPTFALFFLFFARGFFLRRASKSCNIIVTWIYCLIFLERKFGLL